jgi:hypothetical protein
VYPSLTPNALCSLFYAFYARIRGVLETASRANDAFSYTNLLAIKDSFKVPVHTCISIALTQIMRWCRQPMTNWRDIALFHSRHRSGLFLMPLPDNLQTECSMWCALVAACITIVQLLWYILRPSGGHIRRTFSGHKVVQHRLRTDDTRRSFHSIRRIDKCGIGIVPQQRVQKRAG